ncbi:endonuclease/exonuclease/phosphatase family protein [Microbacterium sp. ISL-103]|uniref:endonuclease/exonuclease/phosphatase family protein n=1 Tax=Microbacterium sp. ISL-103 TaxID=2819156 RepID=UPI001BEA79B8|nr:endonuclease/exonuclease/phosphatase family protein [Microbacterium sp. ISL-103]MBT2473438.1 endonuclease/exonuclease/phosphatase family protein [Microbacterium sp. ISL-103]
MTQPLLDAPAPADIHVISFNIRRAMDGPLHRPRDRWSVRAPVVASLLRSERPTILGLQEALPRAMDVVMNALGPTYRFIGRGRGRAGAGEGVPLVYDAERLRLHAWDQRSLSAHPHRAASRSWGNVIPRILVWAEFSVRSTNTRFLAVNTHLDHLSPGSRRHSAEAIAGVVASTGLPALVMGDLNAGPRSRAVRTLLTRGGLVDSWRSADRRLTPLWGSLSGYRRPRVAARRVDWILATPDVRVRAAAMNARSFEGVRPSDHLPAQALLRIDEETR